VINTRLLKNFDFLLLFLTLALAVYGLVMIYSATHVMGLADPFFYVKRQAMWLGAGMGGIILVSLIDYQNFSNWARYIYLIGLAMLGAVLILGEGTEVQRWIHLGFIDIQPSEYAKLVLIIILARVLSEREKHLGENFFAFLPTLLFTAVPMILVFMQPDLGTAMVFIVILFGLLYVAGVNWKYIMGIIGVGAAFAPFAWAQLAVYQQMRLLSFLNPELDPMQSGYQLMQSKTAIGSGGVIGKGLFDGTQVSLQYIPEQHTDFIFSVLGEELGIIGSAGLLLLFFLLIYRILWIGTQSKDTFGSLICCGVAIMIAFHVLVNVGMTMGIMPITGLPLPFISYGGNSLLVNFLAVGLVINVGIRRQKIQF